MGYRGILPLLPQPPALRLFLPSSAFRTMNSAPCFFLLKRIYSPSKHTSACTYDDIITLNRLFAYQSKVFSDGFPYRSAAEIPDSPTVTDDVGNAEPVDSFLQHSKCDSADSSALSRESAAACQRCPRQAPRQAGVGERAEQLGVRLLEPH